MFATMPVAAFVYLQFRDTKRSRLLFFLAYATYQLLAQVLHLFKKHWFEATEEETEALRQACGQIGYTTGFVSMGYEDVEDCERKQIGFITLLSNISLGIGIVFAIYFPYVAYVHYRCSDLPERLGGCPKLPVLPLAQRNTTLNGRAAAPV